MQLLLSRNYYAPGILFNIFFVKFLSGLMSVSQILIRMGLNLGVHIVYFKNAKVKRDSVIKFLGLQNQTRKAPGKLGHKITLASILFHG